MLAPDQILPAATAGDERFRALFDAFDEGLCIVRFVDGPHGPLSDYVYIGANAAYARIVGIADVVGQHVRSIAPDEADERVARFSRVLRTGVPLRSERILAATGRHLDLAAFRLEPASLNQVGIVCRDVTGHKHATRELSDLNRTLEARVADAMAECKLVADVVDRANSFIQIVSNDLTWLAVNRAAAAEFERIFGVRPYVGGNMSQLLEHLPAERDSVEQTWRRALAGEEYVEVREFGDPDRDRRWYEMRFSLLRDDAGEQIGAYEFAYDVTARVQAQQRLAETEEALRQSQKMEAVGQLTGGLAHDFNNLLTGMMGNLELLQTRIARGRIDDLDRFILAAQGAGRRAASLTQRLLAFSRRQTLDPKAADVNRLIAEMEDMLRRAVGPSNVVEFVGAAGLWTANIDAGQLENALLNLCINARDAMPDGGRITIETANEWLDERAAKEHDLGPGEYLSIRVTDTGSGMSTDTLERAFEPFFTTKPIGEGTGLGLSMIYGFARQSGGQVRISSAVDSGTTVCIYLPRHTGGAESTEADAAVPVIASASGQAVLVIDDEATIRHLIDEVLSDLGYTVIGVADGAAGLKVLQSGARIDLLITDVGLPNGMNGRQVADAARGIRPNLKVLFITGYAENAAVRNGHLEPGMALLTKPFTMAAIALKVADMIKLGT